MRHYTYGPFQSRRLGLSLGVDILPRQKICSFNCVYCEIGTTIQHVSPDKTINYPPSQNFRKELKDILKYFPHLNSITFGYNGEPSLNESLLDFLDIAKDVRERLYWIREKPMLTLFTNSSTLYRKEIIERVKQFDLVLAKLDAATEDDYRRTNRPYPESPSIDTIIQSLVELRAEMPTNKLAIQCLIYDSYRKDFVSNNNNKNIVKLADAIKRINPDIVQIYSVARIPAEYFVFSIDEERKKWIVKTLKEIISNDFMEINYY
jgi:wyosine [tRNA(Phe)-imidazoG37] synthetase (radical SAM superfamily)